MNPGAAAALLAALAAIAAAGVIAGYRRNDLAPVQGFGDPLEDRRLALERSLDDLEEAHTSGALEDGDYRRLRSETDARLDRVARAIAGREVPPAAMPPAIAAGPRAPMRVPTWAVGVLLAGVVGAVVLSSLTGRTETEPIASAPSVDADDPFAFFEQRVQEHPNDLAARLDLARRYLDARRIEEALSEYRVALELDPDGAEAHAQIGLILLANDRPEEALASVDAALATAPDYPEARFYRGVILLKGLDRPADAIVEFERYLEIAPFGELRHLADQQIARAQDALDTSG